MKINTTLIMIAVFTVIIVVSIVVFLGLKERPIDDNLLVIPPEPMPETGGNKWSLDPKNNPIKYSRPDNYCENLYLNEDDPDIDCRICQNNIDKAKEESWKNPIYESCPFMDTKNCQACFFDAILDHDPRKCAGSWKLTTTDPCGK